MPRFIIDQDGNHDPRQTVCLSLSIKTDARIDEIARVLLERGVKNVTRSSVVRHVLRAFDAGGEVPAELK